MSAHTPGPWSIYHGDEIVAGAGGDDSLTGTRFVASCRPSSAYRPADETGANARLIAAAPELLDALRGLFEYCAMIHKQWGEGSNAKEAQAAEDDARAAIAKAEGRDA